jgi:hypothetical protein
MGQVIDILEKIPTTKIRILVTVLLIGGTGVVYLIFACHSMTPSGTCTSWEPSSNWLIFLSALAGVDITQYAAKSFVGIKHAELNGTIANENCEPVEASVSTEIEDSTASTDVSEIHETIQEQKG